MPAEGERVYQQRIRKMKIGMLFFDNSEVTVETKVLKAARYYCGKYGVRPALCFVNPKIVGDIPGSITVDGIDVRTSVSVPVNHFWIGV